MKAGFKKTEVGLIPKDWDYQPFSHLYKEPSRNGIYKASEYQGRGTRIVNMKEMFGFNFISDQDMSRIALTTLELSVGGLQDGDLLFGRRSVVPSGAGKCSLVISPAEPITFESSIIRTRLDKKKACPLYYYYFFASSVGRTLVGTIISGTNIKGIRASELRELKVPLPPSPEQQTIAVALSDTDTLIESLERLITKKRNIKQGAMQELLTGKRRLQGFSGKWEKIVFGSIAERIVGGGTPSRAVANYWNGAIPWMTVKDFAQYSAIGTLEYITNEGLKNSASHLIPKHTLITSTRMALGKAVIFDVDVSINQDLKAIFPTKDVDARFLYFWFQFNEKRIAELGSGSTVMGISLGELKKIPFSKPQLPEQTAIATILSDMDTEIKALETKLEKAQRMKQGMMHELLTGRIRLV